MHELHQKILTRFKAGRNHGENQTVLNRKNKFNTLIMALFVFALSPTGIANEWADYYFPDALESYWVYEEQDGNEFTRYAIEPEEVKGETYRAFTYTPRLEDWADYEYYVRPYFYHVSDDWIAFFVGDELENAGKAAMTEKIEEGLGAVHETMRSQGMPDGVSLDIDYDVQVEAQDYFYFLPTPVTFNEEWDAMQANATVTVTIEVLGLPIELSEAKQTITTYLTIVETGKVVGTETVETEVGTFEDCLKIEFQTETATEVVFPPALQQEGIGLEEQQADESFTTFWLAPNVGIVKWTHEHENSDEVKTMELIQYDIKSAESPSSDGN